MCIQDCPAQGQSKAHAAFPVRGFVAGGIKHLENPVFGFIRDSRAIIADFYDGISIVFITFYGDAGAIGRVLDGIVNQVCDDLYDQLRIHACQDVIPFLCYMRSSVSMCSWTAPPSILVMESRFSTREISHMESS